MDLFDEKGTFQDKIGDYPSRNIPDDLSWDKMGPAILAGVEKRKKKRRLLIWFWGVSLGFIGFALLAWWVGNPFNNKRLQTSTLPIAMTNSKNNHLLSNKSSEAAISEILKKGKHSPVIEKGDTQKNYEVQEFPINNKKKIIIVKSKPATSAQVNRLTLPSLQFQKEQKDLTKEKGSKVIKADIRRLRNIISIDRLPVLSSPLLNKNREFAIPFPPRTNTTFFPKWQLEVAGGINWWQDGLSAQNSMDTINTPLLGWQFNARINRYIGKHWTMKLGLQIQNLRYKSAFEHTEGTAIYQPNTVDVIFTNSLTGEQSITYRDSIPGVKTRKFQHFNQHTTLQIPLLVGFTFGKKRWRYSIHTGMSLQLFHLNKGRLAVEEGSVINLPDKTLYPVKVKFNYLLEIQLSYHLSKNISVLGRVSRERHLTNWIAKDFQFQQRPKIGYSSLGFAWSF